MTEYKNLIPENIILKGIFLKQYTGTNEMAWEYQDAMTVLDVLETKGIKILGGDVYCVSLGNVSITYDSWYYVDNNKEDFVKDSAEKAREYISSYHTNNGEEFIYSIVFTR